MKVAKLAIHHAGEPGEGKRRRKGHQRKRQLTSKTPTEHLFGPGKENGQKEERESVEEMLVHTRRGQGDGSRPQGPEVRGGGKKKF